MKAIKSIFLILLGIFAFGASAAPSDTLKSFVKLEEIKFNSDFEKKAFEDHFLNKQDNYLALFSALSIGIDNNTFQVNQRHYQEKLEKIKAQKLGSKKEDKQIKAIYKTAHDSFLKKYELINEFSQIFSNGQYNCVSASALYGMIFQDLNIPFTIKETPSHVYIIAFPESHRILVETTDPNGGFYVFDNKYKTNYVNKLKQNKIISNEDFANNSTDLLFDKYYFSDENIGLEKLVGIQYFNNALVRLDENKPEEALVQLEKAYLFYPSEKADFLLHLSLGLILNNQDFTTLKNVGYLAKLSRFKDAAQNTDIYAHFHKITQDYLVNKYKPTYYKEVYDYLMENIESKEIKDEISYIYFYESGRIAFNKGKYKDSFEASKQAFLLKPENSDSQILFVSSISQTLSRTSNNADRIKQLEALSLEYPVLLENNLFASFLSQAYLIHFAQYFEMGNGKEGEKYKKLFEKQFQENENSVIETDHIGRAYSLAAVYYFRKGDNVKTRQTLNKGLELAPNNFELKQRLVMLK